MSFKKYFFYCLPQHFLSRLAAKLAECRIVWIKNFFINFFIKKFNINLNEIKTTDLDAYINFNAFFIRELNAAARTIDADPKAIVSPADGTICALGEITDNILIQAKGINYSLEKLLGKQEHLVAEFRHGNFMTIYLSPKDYHRVHMPTDGKLIEMFYIPGRLFSVNAFSNENIPGLFARNERLIMRFDTILGPMVLIMVGAMLVAGIHTKWTGKITPNPYKATRSWDFSAKDEFIKKGEELGHFQYGSTVILLFPENKIAWTKNTSSILLGQEIGRIN